MKKLGFGLMRLPLLDRTDDGSIDLEAAGKLVDRFLEKGFTYFDTAWAYHAHRSEAAVKTLLTDRYPRDRFALATKLHANFLRAPEDRDRIFNAQLEKTGAGYFDRYLLHGIGGLSYPKYLEYDCFNWLREKKRQGLARSIGFSFHGMPELLDEILTNNPDLEFVQLQLNYLDWESPWIRSRECYETARRHNRPIVVMEPVKGGTLARLPEEAERLLKSCAPDASVSSWALRFAASLEGVTTVLSGMGSLEQMEDNTGSFDDFQPLTSEERALVFRAAEIVNARTAVPCTGCAYCVEGCPRKIAIPQYFSLYNEDMRESLETKGWTANYNNYILLTWKFGRAVDCIACGQCERVCPQQLPVIVHLKRVASHFDGV